MIQPQHIARIIGKHCKRESIKNVKKRREIWRNIILKNLLEENLQKKLLNEKRICLILDNFSVHKSAFIKKIAKILNIELINLPPYSPHLNPIEQLWRIMKNIIRNENLKSREHLKELVKKTFNENIEKGGYYHSCYPKENYIVSRNKGRCREKPCKVFGLFGPAEG